MNGPILASISRSAFGMVIVVAAAMLSTSESAGQESASLGVGVDSTGLQSFQWNFGRETDQNSNRRPDGWIRTTGTGYPRYVRVEIVPHDPDFAQRIVNLDAGVMEVWKEIRKVLEALPPLPPPILDAMVDRYLRIELDGGQARIQSPSVAASRVFQYRFSCRMMTEGLRHDSARAEFVFLNQQDEEISVHSTAAMRGTTDWTQVTIDFVRPPVGAAKMIVRLIVERSENGLEDIRGAIGFDDIRIDRYPHLRITTDEALGVYAYGQPIVTTARIMGLPAGSSEIQFRIFDHRDREIAATRIRARHESSVPSEPGEKTIATLGSERITWTAPPLDPGFYRMTASLPGKIAATLSTETTLAVIDPQFGGPPLGPFGWSLPNGNEGIPPKELASWLTDLGVAWVKYPSWLAAEDSAGVEQIATIFAKLQDAQIQAVGMLDKPPESQHPLYGVQGRRDMVASQLFRDAATWQPLLAPVMNRLSLKVRMWQLGADRDHSFLGRPNLREAVRQISAGLQGYGQPIRIAISWPWLVQEIPDEESSWHAVCRSTDPPLGANELDAFLSLTAKDSLYNGPRTWLMLDPIPADQYDRDSRIRDLVMRMATVRSHRVQAAFISDPRDPQQGLLRPNGRPDELLLPWRTTSRLIGNLNRTGTLQLRSSAKNIVFANSNRAVLMLWSAEPTEELIYLGEDVSSVDVWGKATKLRVELNGNQPVQRIKIGPLPTFIIDVDPMLLAFRMSVAVKEKQLDSFLGQVQKLSVEFVNPISASLVGETRILPPKTWTVESPTQTWEALADREATQTFDIVLTNTAKIGTHELPIQFEIDTDPPNIITVYRDIKVGPEGLDLTVTTKLLPSGDVHITIEFTNRGTRSHSYDCILFPPPGRQYQRQVIPIQPGETVSRVIRWPNGADLIGKRMLLRAVELDGRRALNYAIDVSR